MFRRLIVPEIQRLSFPHPFSAPQMLPRLGLPRIFFFYLFPCWGSLWTLRTRNLGWGLIFASLVRNSSWCQIGRDGEVDPKSREDFECFPPPLWFSKFCRSPSWILEKLKSKPIPHTSELVFCTTVVLHTSALACFSWSLCLFKCLHFP